MITLARRLHPSLEFCEADAEALRFADGAFTAAVSNFVVPHLGRHERAVGELVRVLSDGGRLAMTTWDFPDRMRLIGVFLDAFAEAGAAVPDGIPAGPPFFRYSGDEEFAALLADGGLTGVQVDTIAFDQHVATADQLWDGVVTGTVRTSALITGLPEQTRLRVRAAFDRLVTQYRRGDHFEFPVSVKLAHGHRARRG
jgi:SAM-dependent methyltransferase